MTNEEVLWVVGFIQRNEIDKFYKTTIWKKLREKVLDINNYDCQHCKSKGRANKANTVHHIKHLKEHPELALDENNLMAVCKECHNELHPEKHYSFMRHRSSKKKFINEELW